MEFLSCTDLMTLVTFQEIITIFFMVYLNQNIVNYKLDMHKRTINNNNILKVYYKNTN